MCPTRRDNSLVHYFAEVDIECFESFLPPQIHSVTQSRYLLRFILQNTNYDCNASVNLANCSSSTDIPASITHNYGVVPCIVIPGWMVMDADPKTVLVKRHSKDK